MQEQGVWGELPPVGDLCWSSLLLGYGWTLWYGAMWEQFLKSCCLWAAPQDQFSKDGILWEGPHVEQGQRVTVKEQQRRSVRD